MPTDYSAEHIICRDVPESIASLTKAVGFDQLRKRRSLYRYSAPAGGLALDYCRWVASKPGFFLPVRVLSRIFRGKMLAFLPHASYSQQQLYFTGILTLRITTISLQFLTKPGGYMKCGYTIRPSAATGHPVAKGVDFMRADIVPGAVFPDYELTRAHGEKPESLFLSVELKLLS